MKRFVCLLAFCFLATVAIGQACGIYRVQYMIHSNNKALSAVYVPSMKLWHYTDIATTDSFETAKRRGSDYSLHLNSPLTTPFNNIDWLLTFYKSTHTYLPIKVQYNDKGNTISETIQIPWENVKVQIVDDGKIGTLFRFDIVYPT